MSAKMVQIGARIPQEDAEFISQLKVNGATTPSDKVRAIIAEARRRQQGAQDYQAGLNMMNELLGPVITHVRQLELKQQVHSELVSRTLEWLPEVLAFAVSSTSGLQDDKDVNALGHFEQSLADRVFRLMESILQMGVTQRCPCYDRRTILDRIDPILDLTRVINQTRNTATEE
ncbi:MAG: hypothetical protein R3330_03505 [Saprospiraceae bacterium]|nr:hypothetical protein [Saprospiraceae bacterium]